MEEDRRFGEQGAKLSYGDYLRLPDLLGAQRTLSGGEGAPPAAHDELLFITIHQVYELWFKLVLYELDDARDLMLAGDTYTPRLRLERAHAIERVLIEQIDILETMSPRDFLEFRSLLAPASGFQSTQFREIEFVSGLREAGYLDRLRDATEPERDRLRRRLTEPTLWEAFVTLLADAGFPVGDEAERRDALRAIGAERGSFGPLWDLAEALLEHDELWARWRARHVVMVERQIGTKRGTGGSTGVRYLRGRVDVTFYPELWALRSDL